MPFLDAVGLNWRRRLGGRASRARRDGASSRSAPAVRVRFNELREGLAEGSAARRATRGGGWGSSSWSSSWRRRWSCSSARACLARASTGCSRRPRVRSRRARHDPVAAPGCGSSRLTPHTGSTRSSVERVMQVPGVTVRRARRSAAGDLQRQHGLDPFRRPALQRRAQRGEPARTSAPRYFATVGARIVRGRGITDRERLGTPKVVVINQTLARKYFPDRGPARQAVRQHRRWLRTRSRRSSGSSRTSTRARSTPTSGRPCTAARAESDTDSWRSWHGPPQAAAGGSWRRSRPPFARSIRRRRVCHSGDRGSGSRIRPRPTCSAPRRGWSAASRGWR